MFKNWTFIQYLVFSIPFVLVVAAVAAAYLLRGTLRSRLQMQLQLQADPDITEFLVIYDWSRKALYLPTVVGSLLAFVVALSHEHGLIRLSPGQLNLVGGLWLALFFVNFLVDEFEVNLKVLLGLVLGLGALFLWLLYLGITKSFIDFFRNLGVTMNSTGYLLFSMILLLAIFISWFKGLFYYVTVTPNYMNIQEGATESGEQIGREEYNSRVDTADFLERLLGFGRIIITFRDTRRMPMSLLVWRIGRKAKTLEEIRGVIDVNR